MRFIQELQVNRQCEDYEKQIDKVRFSTGITSKQPVRGLREADRPGEI